MPTRNEPIAVMVRIAAIIVLIAMAVVANVNIAGAGTTAQDVIAMSSNGRCALRKSGFAMMMPTAGHYAAS